MPDFGLDEDDIRWTLGRVHRGQALFMLFIGTLLLIAPQSRFGPSYHFILQAPGGKYNFAVVFIAIGAFLCWAIPHHDRKMMTRGLFIGAMANLFLGVSLATGALLGPTGVLGAPYTLYVALHMFTQAELLGKRR
jgi:hypothetical protein